MLNLVWRKECCNPTHRTRDIAFGKNAILNWPPLLIAILLRGLSLFFVIRITSPSIPSSGALSRQIIPKNSNFHYGSRTIFLGNAHEVWFRFISINFQNPSAQLHERNFEFSRPIVDKGLHFWNSYIFWGWWIRDSNYWFCKWSV